MTIDTDDSPAIIVGAEIMDAMDKEFHDAPDRVLAIVSAAYLDSLLEQLLLAVFISEKKAVDDLLATHGPLGTYGSRYQLAYCLGLINDRERDDLKMIAKIRNAFAHQYDVRSFDHDEPTKFITKLHVGKELDAIVEDLASRTKDAAQKERLREIGSSGRRKFQDTVRSSFILLLQKLHVAAQ
jgi:DNA-binding MltR family transcriptional regulator